MLFVPNLLIVSEEIRGKDYFKQVTDQMCEGHGDLAFDEKAISVRISFSLGSACATTDWHFR